MAPFSQILEGLIPEVPLYIYTKYYSLSHIFMIVAFDKEKASATKHSTAQNSPGFAPPYVKVVYDIWSLVIEVLLIGFI